MAKVGSLSSLPLQPAIYQALYAVFSIYYLVLNKTVLPDHFNCIMIDFVLIHAIKMPS